MSPRNFLLVSVCVGFIGIGCAQQKPGTPLAVEIKQNVAQRSSISCDDVEAHYRIAQGVRTGLDIAKYQRQILQELAGWSAPAMPLSEARSFSEGSARLLREELTRRCPQHRIKGREDIVYIPS